MKYMASSEGNGCLRLYKSSTTAKEVSYLGLYVRLHT